MRADRQTEQTRSPQYFASLSGGVNTLLRDEHVSTKGPELINGCFDVAGNGRLTSVGSQLLSFQRSLVRPAPFSSTVTRPRRNPVRHGLRTVWLCRQFWCRQWWIAGYSRGVFVDQCCSGPGTWLAYGGIRAFKIKQNAAKLEKKNFAKVRGNLAHTFTSFCELLHVFAAFIYFILFYSILFYFTCADPLIQNSCPLGPWQPSHTTHPTWTVT